MSQHDMTVDNGAGLAVRADINNALRALVSQSSGATAPSPSFPCQLWADTGTGRLKRRDSANTLWLDCGVLDALGEIQTVASASLTDIGAATSRVISISGATNITGLGTIAAGVTRTVRFLGGLVLIHNAVSLILPGGLNITTAANDSAEFQSLGSGNWICLRYTLNNTKPAPTVGLVSQSGGAPSGAIIETATNANGTYTKFADGTLICQGPMNDFQVLSGAIATTSSAATFPALFINALYYFQATGSPNVSNDVYGFMGSSKSTSAATSIYRNGATTQFIINCRYLAVGRWF